MTLRPAVAMADSGTSPADPSPGFHILPQHTAIAPTTVVKNLDSAPASTGPIDTVNDDPPGAIFAPRRPIIISAFQTTGGPQFIELSNTNTASKSPISVEGWHLSVSYVDNTTCNIPLHDAIVSKSHVIVARAGSDVDDGIAETFSGCDSNGIMTKLQMYDHDALVERLIIPTNLDVQQWQRQGVTPSHETGDFNTDFAAVTDEINLVDDAWYHTPPKPSLKVTEILINPRDCLPNDTGLDCYDYVKLANTGDTDVDLSSYRVRSGYKNANASASNTIQLTGIMPAHSTVRIDHDENGRPASIAANDGTVWLEDYYGLATYDLGIPPYVDSAKAAHQGESWAYDTSDKTWKWAVPSPTTIENNFAIPKPDVKVSSVVTTQYKPCAANQYRSPETRRCRLTATVSSTLVSCKVGQYRSAQTNRCRAVLGASTTRKPCAKNQERNPDTNRCRMVQTKLANADFAVEPVKQGVKSFTGWWAIGGLAVLTAGYASWEWRDEIRRLIGRVGALGTHGK